MKKIILTISIFSVGLFFLSCVQSAIKSSKNKNELLKEAKLLNHADSQYLNARLQNKWKAIYEFQHPEYRKAISFEEFQYFGGYVAVNYREDKYFHISGVPRHPSVEDIKKNTFRKNHFTGVPILPTYSLILNKLAAITSHKLERIAIDDSGSIGKVIINLKTVERMPPIFRMPNSKIKRDIIYTDYWEKVNNKWVLAIMKPFPDRERRISGTQQKTYNHPVPVNLSRWDSANFIKFDPEQLNSAPQNKLK